MSWKDAPLRPIPLVYRNDGFSVFFYHQAMTQASLEDRFVNPLAGKNVAVLE